MITEKIKFENVTQFDLLKFRDETIEMLSGTLLVVNRFESTLRECYEQYPDVYGNALILWEETLEKILYESGDITGKDVLRAARDVLRTYRHSVDNWKAKMDRLRNEESLEGMPDEFFMMRELSKALIRNGYNEAKACGWKRELFADVIMAREFVEGWLATVRPLIGYLEAEMDNLEQSGGLPLGTFMKKYVRREKNAESARAS